MSIDLDNMSNGWRDWRSDFWSVLETDVFPRPSSPRLFNMYRDVVPGLDGDRADVVRRSNLAAYFDCFRSKPVWLIVAEAPGPWGCRFSGVPITSEEQLADPTFPISGERSSVHGDGPLREYSAGIFWRVLADAFPSFLVWNTVPYHPHRKGKPLSIRTPTSAEVADGGRILRHLCELLNPERTFAVGRKAESALGTIGVECTYVRHPSQGGARVFADTMATHILAAGFSDSAARHEVDHGR